MSRYYMTPFESMIGHTTLKTVNKFSQIEQGNPRKVWQIYYPKSLVILQNSVLIKTQFEKKYVFDYENYRSTRHLFTVLSR